MMLAGNAWALGSRRLVKFGVRRGNSGHPKAGRAVQWFGWKWWDFFPLQTCSLAACSHHSLPRFRSIAAHSYQFWLFLYPKLVLFCSEKTGSLSGSLDAFHFPCAFFFGGLWGFVVFWFFCFFFFKEIILISDYILVTQTVYLPMEEFFDTKGPKTQFGHAALTHNVTNTAIYSMHLSATSLYLFNSFPPQFLIWQQKTNYFHQRNEGRLSTLSQEPRWTPVIRHHTR